MFGLPGFDGTMVTITASRMLLPIGLCLIMIALALSRLGVELRPNAIVGRAPGGPGG